jgi:hypothetical protein
MLCSPRNLALFLVMQWSPGRIKSLVDAFWVPVACTIRHLHVNIECTMLSLYLLSVSQFGHALLCF